MKTLLKELEEQRNKLNLKIEYLIKTNKGTKAYSPIKLKKALKRIYQVRTQGKGEGNKIACRICLPVCFRNKKVKLKIVK